jgi:hypothetical protein
MNELVENQTGGLERIASVVEIDLAIPNSVVIRSVFYFVQLLLCNVPNT